MGEVECWTSEPGVFEPIEIAPMERAAQIDVALFVSPVPGEFQRGEQVSRMQQKEVRIVGVGR